MVELTVKLKVTASKISSGSCSLPEVAVWVPVAPTVTTLPAAPSIVVNSTPVPEDSVPIPEDFDLDNPDLCTLFSSLLVGSSPPVYAQELSVETLILPFNETVEFESLLRVKQEVYRFPYSLKPKIENVAPSLKVRLYAARLKKYKTETTTVTLSHPDTTFRRTYVLPATAGQFTISDFEIYFLPRRFNAESASFEITGSDAALRRPGVFSVGMSSTSSFGSGDPTPASVWYRRNVHQLLYTSSLLTQYGMRYPAKIKTISWFVTDSVPDGYRHTDFTMRMFHTSRTNGNQGNIVPLDGENSTAILGPTSSNIFGTVGLITFELSTPFEWDGVNSICIETCTSGNLTNYISRGSLKSFNTGSTAINYRRYYRDDDVGVSACGFSTTNHDYRIVSTEMAFD